MQADGIVAPGAHRDLPAREDRRHRRDSKRDQGDVRRLIHHGQRRGQPDHEQRHQDEHRHHGANAEPRVAQQQQRIRGSRTQADGSHRERYARHQDEFDDVRAVQRGGSLCLAPPAVRFLSAGPAPQQVVREMWEHAFPACGPKALADRRSRLASGCRTFIVFATIMAQPKLAIRR